MQTAGFYVFHLKLETFIENWKFLLVFTVNTKALQKPKDSNTILTFIIPNIQLYENYMLHNWKPTSLDELTPIIFNKGLTHLDSKASIY